MKKILIASLLSYAGLTAAVFSIIYLAISYTGNQAPSALVLLSIASGVYLILKGNSLREQEEVLEAYKEILNRKTTK